MNTAQHSKTSVTSEIENLKHQFSADKQLYEQEIKMLRIKIEECEEEIEEQKNQLQIKSEIDQRVEE
jgi:hypothetical protein